MRKITIYIVIFFFLFLTPQLASVFCDENNSNEKWDQALEFIPGKASFFGIWINPDKWELLEFNTLDCSNVHRFMSKQGGILGTLSHSFKSFSYDKFKEQILASDESKSEWEIISFEEIMVNERSMRLLQVNTIYKDDSKPSIANLILIHTDGKKTVSLSAISSLENFPNVKDEMLEFLNGLTIID
ncbi:MAG: hypothetical protein Q8K60_01415 [Parachlamydiaceae bacterium]|nr:hypothetical protein [Parachlamydiaceae bacterium]